MDAYKILYPKNIQTHPHYVHRRLYFHRTTPDVKSVRPSQ